jgi:hypothetical protein
MKRSETGKPALLRFLPINCEPSDEGKQDAHGTWMKPTSKSRENGAICIGPSIGMVIWLIRWRVEKRDMEAAKRFDLRKPSRWLVTPQNR